MNWYKIAQSTIEIDINKYLSSMEEYLIYLSSRENSSYTEENVKDDMIRFTEQVKKNMDVIKNNVIKAIGSISNWNGSVIKIETPAFDKSWDYLSNVPNSAYVEVGKDSAWGGIPGFSYFVDEGNNAIVDDVLESGDNDFFTNSQQTSDYFNLINELRNPGRSKQSKKVVLYTARPVSDRGMYINATSLPPNLFLTTDFNRAEGIAIDLSGKEKSRDIWKVRMDEKYLIETLNVMGRVKDYQIVGSEPVPIDYIKLISAGEKSELV